MIEFTFKAEPLTAVFDEDALLLAADEAAREVMRRRGLRRGGNLVGATEEANEAAAEELDRQTRTGQAGFRESKK